MGGGVFIQDLLFLPKSGEGAIAPLHWPDSDGPVQVDLVIPVEPCVEKLLLSVECFCKEVHTVKESNTYLLVKVIHRTFAASQNVVKPWIWIFSYENIAKVIDTRVHNLCPG